MNSNNDDDDDDEDDDNDDDDYDKCRYSNQETVAQSCIPCPGCFKMARTLDLYKEWQDRMLRLLRENVTKVYCKVRI